MTTVLWAWLNVLPTEGNSTLMISPKRYCAQSEMPILALFLSGLNSIHSWFLVYFFAGQRQRYWRRTCAGLATISYLYLRVILSIILEQDQNKPTAPTSCNQARTQLPTRLSLTHPPSTYSSIINQLTLPCPNLQRPSSLPFAANPRPLYLIQPLSSSCYEERQRPKAEGGQRGGASGEQKAEENGEGRREESEMKWLHRLVQVVQQKP